MSAGFTTVASELLAKVTPAAQQYAPASKVTKQVSPIKLNNL
jgi:hypothetical protein